MFYVINYLRQCVLSLFQEFSRQPKFAAIPPHTHTEVRVYSDYP